MKSLRYILICVALLAIPLRAEAPVGIDNRTIQFASSVSSVINNLTIHGLNVNDPNKNISSDRRGLDDNSRLEYTGPCYSLDKTNHKVYGATFTVAFYDNGKVGITVVYDPSQVFNYAMDNKNPEIGTVSPANLSNSK